MKSNANFGKLYRAAFAERNPERKLVLLSEVQRALNNWEQEDQTRPAVHLPMEVHPDAPRIIRAA